MLRVIKSLFIVFFQVLDYIAKSLVDDNGRNGRDPEFIFQGPCYIKEKLNKGTEFKGKKL